MGAYVDYFETTALAASLCLRSINSAGYELFSPSLPWAYIFEGLSPSISFSVLKALRQYSDSCQLASPPLRIICLALTKAQAFSIVAPILWNGLSEEVWGEPLLEIF